MRALRGLAGVERLQQLAGGLLVLAGGQVHLADEPVGLAGQVGRADALGDLERLTGVIARL
ncbi:hypothetical protein D3C72_2364630 [compost metagenome]